MTSPFDQRRSIFAVLDHEHGWGAYLAARLVVGEANDREVDVRHLDDLEALDSCLVGSDFAVGVLLSDDFAELSAIVGFLERHSTRPKTLLVIADRLVPQSVEQTDAEWLLREAGAHRIVHNMREVIALTGPLRHFFRAYYSESL